MEVYPKNGSKKWRENRKLDYTIWLHDKFYILSSIIKLVGVNFNIIGQWIKIGC